MRIKLTTGEILEAERIITDASDGRELGYLVRKNDSQDGWICPKEKVVEEKK